MKQDFKMRMRQVHAIATDIRDHLAAGEWVKADRQAGLLLSLARGAAGGDDD